MLIAEIENVHLLFMFTALVDQPYSMLMSVFLVCNYFCFMLKFLLVLCSCFMHRSF